MAAHRRGAPAHRARALRRCACRAAGAVAQGRERGEVDLETFARMLTARSLLLAGRLDEGLSDMDQAMLRVTSGQTSPRMTGILYCAAIGTCEGDAWELARAQEWALSLERWMASLPTLFGGALLDNCRVYRAALKRRRGQLTEAKGSSKRPHATSPTTQTARSLVMRGTSSARCTGCSATTTRPRSPTGEPRRSVPESTRVWRCCASAQETRTPRPQDCAGRWSKPPARRARPVAAFDGVRPRGSGVDGRGGTHPRRARWRFAQHGQLRR